MPGVAAVFTADDLRIPPQKSSGNVEGATGTLDGPFPREVLARDVVRYVGEPVAVVIADSLAHGQDAAELVWPEVDALDAVTDVEAAAADGAPMLFPIHGSNVAHAFEQHWDVDVLEGADVVASARSRAATAGARAHGDERDRGGARGRRRVHDLVLDAGAVRRPERSGGAARGGQEAGAHRGARRRGRVRREAARLSGVRGRGGGREGARPSGPVGRDAVGEHAEPQPRPGAGAAGGDRREARRHRRRHARGDPRRHGRVPDRRVPAHHDAGDAVRRLRDPADRIARMERGHEHDAGRGLSRRGPAGGDGAGRARDGSDRGRARDGSGRRPAEEPDPRRRVPVHDRVRHHVRHRGLRARARRGAADRRTCRSSARSRRRAARAATTCCWASGCARTWRSPRSRRRSSARSRCARTAR